MKYSFESEKEILCCFDCPCRSTDDYKADGCNLLNDYISVDAHKEKDKRCPLNKEDFFRKQVTVY